MSSLDKQADLYLDVCQEFIIREYGERALLDRQAGWKIMTGRPAPQDGGKIRCYEVGQREWEEMEDFETGVVIVHDGRVSVSYPCQDVEHGGMNFVVGHPREVSELFHLLVNPVSCITPGEATAWGKRRLGDLIDLHIVIPSGTEWRLLAVASPPPGLPPDFLDAVFFNVVQNWDKLQSGETVQACELAARWPEAVNSLPKADPLIRDGYLLSNTAWVRSALDRAATGPDAAQLFLELLLVPRSQRVSCLHLRELLGRDQETGKAIRNAFDASSTLAALNEAVGGIELYLPEKYHHQIRVAAEHVLIREWLRSMAAELCDGRECYHVQDDKQWHLAHVLSRMINMSNV